MSGQRVETQNVDLQEPRLVCMEASEERSEAKPACRNSESLDLQEPRLVWMKVSEERSEAKPACRNSESLELPAPFWKMAGCR
jgi:hypothetical protein